MARLGLKSRGLLLAMLIMLSLATLAGVVQAQGTTIRVGPSALCHVTDGAFTDCAPGAEWSDIDFLPWAGADVYTDQSVSPPSLHLMYDLLSHHAPLGPAESFDIRFNTVDGGRFEDYLVQVFGNGLVKIFVDGVEQSDPEGIAGAVGFGPSPLTSFFDVFVELSVPLNVVYSPDIPLFWSTAAPQPRGCQPGSQGCCKLGDPNCHPPGSTAALATAATVPISQSIVVANSDGTTTVTPVPFGAMPSDFCSRATGGGILGDLIDSLLPPTGTYRNHGDYVSQVTRKTKQAIGSLMFSHLVTAREAEDLHSCIVSTRAQNNAGKK